jgi:CubicO group peptidase (beta-lactamase class C family)
MPYLTRRQFSSLPLTVAASRAKLLSAPTNIENTLRSRIAKRKIPAVSAMAATKDKTLYRGAFGTRDASGVPVTPDSIFAIASMTKAIATTAALQMVERGKVQLDEDASKHLPQLANLDVLRGFDSGGKPILSPAKSAVTLRQLLTHTSGFCYDIWDGDMFRYVTETKGQPASSKPGPLMFEPGTRWQYGQGIDWAGRLVESISGKNLEEYLQSEILGPLEMHDTSYILPAAKFDRLVATYQRQPDGSLTQYPRKLPDPPKTFNGGGGLYSTTADYVRFMQMILNRGQGINKARILHPETVAMMQINQIGSLSAGKMKSYRPATSSDVDIQPGATEKWGLGFLINTTPYAGGRSAGSLAWAGIDNTFFWIDPKRSLCAVIMMQFLPFVDKEAIGLLGDFEKAVYS